MSAPTPALEMRGITKRFGGVVACDGVDLTVMPGEIHGLLGQNGAGKSTLMKILIGLVAADAGIVRIAGAPVAVTNPLAAAAAGIAMVHQHFSVIGPLTVWENVTLGETGRLKPERAIGEVKDICERYGLDLDARAKVSDLTAGQRQRVEIVKCLRRDPAVLVLDEPTSVLTLAESAELFETLRRSVKAEGRAVVLISHKLDEIMHATDEITVMRDGRVVERVTTAATDIRTLARQMVGREVSLRSEAAALGLAEASSTGPETAPRPIEQPVVRVVDAVVRRPDGALALDRCSFDIFPGEILGLAGVEGNGQTALAGLFHNIVELASGRIEVNGNEVSTRAPGAMSRAGVAVIPEDRHEAGCVLGMSVVENLVLDEVSGVCRRGFISRRLLHERANRLIDRFGIKTPSPDTPMWALSGGNQQRVVLARVLASSPRVVIAAQPTHGLDISAVEFMNSQLRQAADGGIAVLLISTELEEVLSLSDRVAVIHRGRIVGEMQRQEFEVERLGLMMGGEAA